MVGNLTISLEIELGWGYHDLDGFDAGRISEDAQKESEFLRRLLSLCEELAIPLSFDVVGHLLQKPVASVTGPHSDDWFASIRQGTTDPLFYAPDLVSDIQSSSTDHEICTHTYTHVPCEGASAEVIEWELERAQKVHRKLDGTSTVSLVPPRHSPPPKDILEKNGVEIIRVAGYEPAETTTGRINELVFDPPDPKEPRLDDGIVETYCTKYSTLASSMLPYGQNPPPPAVRIVPTSLRQQLHYRYLTHAMEKAIARDSHVHLWAHLHEIANESQWQPLQRFLRDLGTNRDRGDVRVLTMEQLNEQVRAEKRHPSRVPGRQLD